MSDIPKVSEKAIKEAHQAFNKALMESIRSNNPKKMQKVIKETSVFFKEQQPEVYQFIKTITEAHIDHTDGLIIAPQLVLYVMIIIKSMYIQKEIDEISSLFD